MHLNCLGFEYQVRFIRLIAQFCAMYVSGCYGNRHSTFDYLAIAAKILHVIQYTKCRLMMHQNGNKFFSFFFRDRKLHLWDARRSTHEFINKKWKQNENKKSKSMTNQMNRRMKNLHVHAISHGSKLLQRFDWGTVKHQTVDRKTKKKKKNNWSITDNNQQQITVKISIDIFLTYFVWTTNYGVINR